MDKLYSRENKYYITSEELRNHYGKNGEGNFMDDAELDREAMFNEIKRRHSR